MEDKGILQSAGESPNNALPASWLNRADAPGARPDYSVISIFTSAQQRNLLSQIAYEKSLWDYKKIGTTNNLGRYQISTIQLENYGLISAGSNAAYGNDCINYRNVWKPKVDAKSYYNFQLTSLQDFLGNKMAQDYLAYQILYDLYTGASKIAVVKPTDSAETLAGMLYVCWELGVGTSPNRDSPTGTGAWAWRYKNIGSAGTYYNSGRYAIKVLSK